MVIGDEILVTVMGVSGHTVRLGIEAPEGVSIYREEIWLAVKEENRAAAAAQATSCPPRPRAHGAGRTRAAAMPRASTAPAGREPGRQRRRGRRPRQPRADAPVRA